MRIDQFEVLQTDTLDSFPIPFKDKSPQFFEKQVDQFDDDNKCNNNPQQFQDADSQILAKERESQLRSSSFFGM